MMRKLFCLVFFLFSSAHAEEMSEFDLFMGKKTHHWNHLNNADDERMLSRFKEIYESQKALQLVKTDVVRIPKVVHFIWLGPKQYPPGSVENIRTWMAYNPDWTFKFWTDRERAAPCNGMETIVIKDYPFPSLRICYETSENWGEKSDCLRFEILYQEGGVYVDHDANCLQSFDGLHKAYDLYCGLEMPHLPMGGYTITLGNGVIGSKPSHPTIKKVIENISSRWDELEKKYEERDAFSRAQVVIERTYLALTLVMKEIAGKSFTQDIILPAAYFFAKPGVKPVYSKHFFANSWAGGVSEKAAFEKSTKGSLQKIEQKVNNSLLFCLAILVFNLVLISFALYFFQRRGV
jgi:mannosyltransferase OCH1-like enzyme